MTIYDKQDLQQAIRALFLVAALTFTARVHADPTTALRPNATSAYLESYAPVHDDRDVRVNVLSLEYERRLQHPWLARLGVGGIASGYLTSGTTYDPGKLFQSPDNGVYDAETSGWGLQGLARLYLVDEARFTLFVEAAAGIAFFDDRFPPNGSKLDFTRRYGVGGTVSVSDSIAVIGGYRWAHISNGNGEGAIDNPAWDGRGPYLGVRWRF